MSIKIIQCEEENETQLFIDGEFLAGWTRFEIPSEIKGRLEYMMTKCFDAGRAERNRELEAFFKNGNAL